MNTTLPLHDFFIYIPSLQEENTTRSVGAEQLQISGQRNAPASLASWDRVLLAESLEVFVSPAHGEK